MKTKNISTPLEEALFIWERREQLTDQDRMDAAVSLSEWGTFSSRQIAAITGIKWWDANALNGKSDRTGGRLNPDTLQVLRDLSVAYKNGEVDVFAVHQVVARGTSTLMASRLTGIPETTIKRHKRRAETLIQEAAA